MAEQQESSNGNSNRNNNRSQNSGKTKEESLVDSAVAEGGAYEIIRKRLVEQGKRLETGAQQLNQARLEEFGSSDMSVLGRCRVRTENNCIARDIAQIGDQLLFGYNVYIGLKKETHIDDVFALFRLTQTESGYEMVAEPIDGSFLANPSFQNDFDELYRYYKHTKLVQLIVKEGKLLAGFQIGERLDDIRVFRWSVSSDGQSVEYIDNRGERDIELPPAYDFEWVETSRDDAVNGRHPHVNILDTVFVETVGGDLTIKIENNTDDGLGIYREPVEDKTQSLDDAKIAYAAVGSLILLRIQPYREEQQRYFIFNCITESVTRIDAIGDACVQLPEDHGVIFPGGYYLQSGEFKRFDDPVAGLSFKRTIRSPNGEDVLYIFYQPEKGMVALFSYNLIEKALQNPVYGHGYALAEDGTLVIFSAESEPTRVHPMQIWQTPFVSMEFASQAPASQTFFGRIGNAELVRGVSDLYSIVRMIDNQSVSARQYEALSKAAKKLFDDHYWVEDPQAFGIADVVKEVDQTTELVIDEFEKVQSIRKQARKVRQEAEKAQAALISSIQPDGWESAEQYVEALAALRQQRGHLITIREQRYIDTSRIDQLESELLEMDKSLSEKTVVFLADEASLDPYLTKVTELNRAIEAASKITELEPVIEQVEATISGLDLLSELMSTLKVDDATLHTAIIDKISHVYSELNRSKANANHRQKGLGSQEASAQFGAQFKLLTQSVTHALGLSTTPEKCEEQLSRLLVQLEELESQFSDFDEFITDILDKREEIYESFEAHKQQLMDERQRRSQSIADAATRILSSIEKRSLKFTEADKLNTFFASDALTLKIRDLTEQLRELDSAVKADDIEAKYKAIKEQALRSLRDKTDIYSEGGNIIQLGPRHKFSVNTQALDLTIIPRDDQLNIHLTGTEFFEPITHPELIALKEYWSLSLESESPDVYRAEYLAMSMIDAIGHEKLHALLSDEQALLAEIRDFSAPRYKEGYVKGIHDADTAELLKALLPAMKQADLLRFDPFSRAIAQLFWTQMITDTERAKSWSARAQSAAEMIEVLGSRDAYEQLTTEIKLELSQFNERHGLLALESTNGDTILEDRKHEDNKHEGNKLKDNTLERAADYLVAELGQERLEFITSKYAVDLVDELKRTLPDSSWRRLHAALETLSDRQTSQSTDRPAERWALAKAWLQALIDQEKQDKQKSYSGRAHYIDEAAVLLVTDQLPRRQTVVDLNLRVEQLMGEHLTIKDRTLTFSLDAFISRLAHHRSVVLPNYRKYLEVRQRIITEERTALRLSSFKARPLASFVRNRLINESYLPLIGDNLAKQMGTVGESKRTDLMGLLMMISPPGYGKTTLMEYVANRLGLIFMKINCPSLGHDVVSLDPQQAPNATAKQELETLNLALEMGNNVMLYLDDIQHTDPEFLQKFISLCDGTRRIEGVWRGKTKTYDMRGRKFCVVMAGNPYTESGEAFKIPDMLANRADIYNLGDILGGMDEQFALSYIENAMTSNPVLAPLATREMSDIYKFIDLAKGRNIASTDFKHGYSGAEINEISDILKKMLVIQDVVLKINQQYIASAAQDDKYRTEPSFKLQGSYRNMNKMTEKISAVMNDEELMQMIADHYLGEAQLLTTGAEDNLLKLAELRGNMTEEQSARWQQIKRDFLRNKAMGGDEGDVGNKVVAQLVDLATAVGSIEQAAERSNKLNERRIKTLLNDKSQPVDAKTVIGVTKHLSQQLTESIEGLNESVKESFKASLTEQQPPPPQPKVNVDVVNQPVPGIDRILRVLADTIENSIFPLMRTMDKKLDIDLQTHEKMVAISNQLRDLEKSLGVKKP